MKTEINKKGNVSELLSIANYTLPKEGLYRRKALWIPEG